MFDSPAFLFLLEDSFDLTQAFCDRDPFGADVRTPPHCFAPPDAVIRIQSFQPFIGGGIARIEDVPEGPQQGRRAKVIRPRPGNRAG